MATKLKPDAEAKLSQLADRMQRSKEDVLEQALNRLLAYYDLVHPPCCQAAASSRQTDELEFKPVEITGEPLSATVLREGR